jgi:hypothetical protein
MNRWRRSRNPQGEQAASRSPDAELGNTPADAVVRTSQASSSVVEGLLIDLEEDRTPKAVI